MTYDDHLRISEAMPGYLGYCKWCGQEEGIPGEFGEDGEKECESCKSINMEEEKKYPKGFDGRQTTKEEWDQYEKELAEHNAHYETLKPLRADCTSIDSYDKAMSQWRFEKSVNAPNKPGYFRSNND